MSALAGTSPRAAGAVRLRRAIGYGLLYAFLTLFSLFMLLPFLFAISGSLKPEPEVFAVPIQWIPTDPATTVMAFCVSVPVLSVQMTDAFAIVSQEPSTRTRRFSFVIRLVANARANVTASGNPVKECFVDASVPRLR